MKRKLILILLAAALLCGVFAAVIIIANREPKKLSEMSDGELYEYLYYKDITFMQIPYESNPAYKSDEDFIRSARKTIARLEEDINSCDGYHKGFTAYWLMDAELRAVVEEYYGIESTVDDSPADGLREAFFEQYGRVE